MIKSNEKVRILRELYKKNQALRPRDIVNEARKEDSPLHDYFEWDDEMAGEAFRLQQARVLINEVKILWKESEIPAYENVKVIVGDTEQRFYMPAERIMESPDLKNQIIEIALNEIKGWTEKYNFYKELEKVVNKEEVERIEAQL